MNVFKASGGQAAWILTVALQSVSTLHGATPTTAAPTVITNRAPLAARLFLDLPPGTIRPKGWLRVQSERMRDGLTGTLDRDYAKVIGARNGWLGGDGDGWERGPYWIDGLLPLAHQLGDTNLLAKARPWIDWTLENQEPSGYLGPKRFEREPAPEAGIQKTPREDWWPRMVMLKVLQQHFMATRDPRVPDVLTKYFRYQQRELQRTPLDHWSFWGNRRGGDNLMVVLWLYNVTGEPFLLELGRLLHQQTFPWTQILSNTDPEPSPDLAHLYPYNVDDRFPFDPHLIRRLSVDQYQSFHCVNLAQGIKAPVVFSQQDPAPSHLAAVKTGLKTLRRFHGQPQGMYGGDEPLHGPDPTQGVELCSVVEMMFSLETMLGITGDTDFADALEWIAYNALPAQTTEDFRARQYFQTANQVLCTRARRNFYEDDYHGGTDLCFGLLTGYPCCTCNMHQGWPKFVQTLWHATSDHGLAALVYGPCEVQAIVGEGGGVPITVVEDTQYPFEESVRFEFRPDRAVEFPFRLRIPSWSSRTELRLNGEPVRFTPVNQFVSLQRRWQPGDRLEIQFTAQTTVTRWFENSVAVQRGPLLYGLRIGEAWNQVEATDDFGSYLEVRPTTPWNFGLLESAVKEPGRGFQLRQAAPLTQGTYPWTQANAPLELETQGKRIPEWTLYGHRAGPLPHSRPSHHLAQQPTETIRLLPYGCTRLRIAEFPVVR
ncbi:MAG: glycoside hydrolase family 127 protein [Verrucomicrobiales bacterium]|nr:glycoside hydrolase family 127 protein [Verrucomicrobiales bacterium]